MTHFPKFAKKEACVVDLQPLGFFERSLTKKMDEIMKRLICLLTALVGVASFNAAQADNFYAGAFGGVNWLQNNRHHQNARTGYLLGLDAGYKWCNGLLTEFEFSYRNNRKNLKNRHYGEGSGSEGSRHGGRKHTQNYAGLINVLYEFDNYGCWCVRPYLGAGIGVASEKRNRNNRGSGSGSCNEEGSGCRRHGSSNGRKSNFAWQLIAGLAYPINDCVDLDLSYRFFKTTHARANNNAIALGVNYNF